MAALPSSLICSLSQQPPATVAQTAAGLPEALAGLPDPRARRCLRHRLTVAVSAAVCAVLAGYRSYTATAEWGADAPAATVAALVYAHNSHLQRDQCRLRMGDLPVAWWSAGAIVSAQLGEGYAFLATALGTIRHHGVETPPPDTIEGLLYGLEQDRCVVDTRRLATLLGGLPAARVSPWFGYSPLDPGHLTNQDAIVLVEDAPPDEAGGRRPEPHQPVSCIAPAGVR